MGIDSQRVPAPWWRGLSGRIIVSYGALFAIVLVVLMTWVGRIVYVAQREEVVHNLERQAMLAADALEDPLSGFGPEFEHEARGHREADEREHVEDREERRDGRAATGPGAAAPGTSRLRRVAVAYASNTGARVTILDAVGNALADSQETVPPQGRRLGPGAMPTRQVTSALRVEPDGGAVSLYVTAPVLTDDRLFGFVQLAVPLASITGRIWTLVLTLGGFGLFALALSALLGIAISRRLVRPLRGLEQASLAMAAGDLSQRVGVDADDEIGALARAFNHMADQVQGVIEQQRLFVANASHELRTPLTNIKLRSEALLSGTDDPVVRDRFLREIDQESDRLARLAGALLDLARLDEAGGASVQAVGDPRETLGRVMDLMTVRAGHAGIQLEGRVPSGLPQVGIGGEALETILINLLDNAIKYTPVGGSVVLTADVAGDGLRIEVRDTGQGIASADLPHVFERFYRADKARSRSRSAWPGTGGGVGLGLAIVKQMVERHGGHISVHSIEGQGTRVTFDVPVSFAAPVPRA